MGNVRPLITVKMISTHFLTGWQPYTGKGKDENKCKKQKIVPGKCHQRYYMAPGTTLVPDRELTCAFYQTKDCNENLKYYTDQDFKDSHVNTPEDRKFFWGKVIGKVSPVVWPCCETFNSDHGINWRVAHKGDAPKAYKCWIPSKEKGLVTK